MSVMKKNILVLCTGNSCRSQMAHGFLNALASDNATIFSAGIETHGLNPGAVSIMKEAGIDISSHTSNHVDEYQDIRKRTVRTYQRRTRKDFITTFSIPLRLREVPKKNMLLF